MKLGGRQNGLAQNAKTLMLDWIGTRTQITFLLDLATARDREAYDIINVLKSKRTFLPSVILGLKIVWEAGQGKYDTLLMSFPDVIEKLQIKISPPPTPPDTKALEDKIEEMQGMIELFIANQKPSGLAMQSTQPTTTGKPLAVATLAMPTFDEDDDLIPMPTKKAATDAGQNFLRSMSGVTH